MGRDSHTGPAPKPAGTTAWHRLDRFLARLRPHREPLSLAIDCAIVALAWNVTYLFRLGFERWISARPGYDGWVLLGIVAVYAIAFRALRVPQGMWRFSGFGEIQRIAIACATAGLVSAVGVLMLRLVQVPRAVLALHPVVALMGGGNGVFHPADFAILNSNVAPRRLGHAYSTHGVGGNLGYAAAPIASFGLAAMFGWRVALVAMGWTVAVPV